MLAQPRCAVGSYARGRFLGGYDGHQREVARHEVIVGHQLAQLRLLLGTDRSSARGQRVRNRQPLGGLIGEGRSPPRLRF